jgi:hypothetical protein
MAAVHYYMLPSPPFFDPQQNRTEDSFLPASHALPSGTFWEATGKQNGS